MVRMQIQLTDEQAAALRRRANARLMSMAAVVREALARELGGESEREIAWARALSVVGRYRGDPANVSVEHDAYLDEAYMPPRR